MKKRLVKAMPHIPLLELRPELSEQEPEEEANDDQENIAGQNVVNGLGHDELNADDSATCQGDSDNDIRKSIVSGKCFRAQVNRVIFKIKQYCSRDRTRNVFANDESSIHYGEEESSESDGEGDDLDVIPLVPRH